MITVEQLKEIQQFQTNYIKNLSADDVYDPLWIQVTNKYGGGDAQLDFNRNIAEIWGLLQNGFKTIFEEFKTVLFAEFPELASVNWDGVIGFYTELWNTHANEVFERSADYDFINLGESIDGGSYFFSLDGYSEENTVSFTKNVDGEILMEYLPYSSS